jgi:FtsP/CotA-like multicopper oxidase with cupredoxin domain
LQGAEYCLSRETLDANTDETVWDLLDLVGVSGGLTGKGCLPPLQIVQGEFDMNLTALPAIAFDKCIGGEGPGGNFVVEVDSSKEWVALSFANPGAQHPLLVSIDNHDLHVYSVDGQYIHPTIADQVVVGNGNRISVIVKLDQKPGRYTIRVAHQLANQVVSGYAQLAYDGAKHQAPDAKAKVDLQGKPLPEVKHFKEFDEMEGRPYPPFKPSGSVSRTHKMLMRKMGQPYTTGDWTLSGSSKYGMSQEQRNTPLLFELPRNNSDLIFTTFRDEWVDLIVETEGPISRYHPMHKHGNKFFVLGMGLGRFPWDTVDEAARALPAGSFNFEDPPYVDTVQTKRSMTGAWLALRYKVEQPGAWLFHCHIQPHLTGGMGIVILDGTDAFPKIPEEYREWNGFDKPTTLA